MRNKWNPLKYIKADPVVLHRLECIEKTQGLILEKLGRIMTALTDAMDQAEAAATANTSADDAAEALLVSIAQMLKDSLAAGGADPALTARLTALSNTINARATQLAAAVVANTPAAPV